MEIKRMGENQIRCALSEEEIRELGYDIDDIIGNTEVTQKFMRSVVELVEEHEHISLDDFSPMVKAELMQDHSMAITFGGETEMNFKNLIDTGGQLMSQAAPEKLNEFRQMNREEKKNMIDEFLQKYAEKSQKKEQKRAASEELSQEQEDREKQSRRKHQRIEISPKKRMRTQYMKVQYHLDLCSTVLMRSYACFGQGHLEKKSHRTAFIK